MYSYHAYGLTIHSLALPLPELLATGNGRDSLPDVLLRHETVSLPAEARRDEYHVHIDAEKAILFNRSVGAVSVGGGREILVDPRPGVADQALRLFLIGPSLAMALHQRDRLVLHASALEMRGAGGAIAFLGHSGQGKSTMAAALHARGHRLVADDVTAILPAGAADEPRIYPGYPALKLWSDAAARLRETDQPFHPLVPGREEYRRGMCPVATDDFSQEPLALRRLYLLEDGDEIRSEPLGPGDALMALLRHSYWVADLPEPQRKAHFRRCGELVGKLPVHRLRRPRDLDRIAEVAERIERDNV